MFPKIKLPGSMTRTNVRFDVFFAAKNFWMELIFQFRFDVFFAAKNFWMEQILQSLLIKSVIALVKQLQPICFFFFSTRFFI